MCQNDQCTECMLFKKAANFWNHLLKFNVLVGKLRKRNKARGRKIKMAEIRGLGQPGKRKYEKKKEHEKDQMEKL